MPIILKPVILAKSHFSVLYYGARNVNDFKETKLVPRRRRQYNRNQCAIKPEIKERPNYRRKRDPAPKWVGTKWSSLKQLASKPTFSKSSMLKFIPPL